MSNGELDTTDPAPHLEYVTLHQIEKPEWTFFYQKNPTEDPDTGEEVPGVIFAAKNQEASLFGKNYRFIGSSDGTAYRDFIRNSGVKRGQLIPIERAREILKGAFDAELAAARGNKKVRPQLKEWHFDASVPLNQRDSFPTNL